MKGQFVISLDFELMWGVFDLHTIETYGENILGGKTAIPKILDLFNQYDIHATWAIVGLLYCKDESELKKSLPPELPSFVNSDYSAYEYIHTINLDDSSQYHFAPELIELINKNPHQEIGTHTFSHFYCLENQKHENAFKEDIKKAIAIAKQKYNCETKSIVFPRNQYNSTNLSDCVQQGIHNFRGVSDAFFYAPRIRKDEILPLRILRFTDSYLNLSGHNAHKVMHLQNGMTNIKASAFLRPYSKKLAYLEHLKIRRIKKSMTHAAQHNLLFHLWWHPHNFGKNLKENLQNLEQILLHYQTLNQKYGFHSLTMQECAQTLKA
jgi:peptidoglycan/xylan/chitin deacetylase (PgdA/CDA1 family)